MSKTTGLNLFNGLPPTKSFINDIRTLIKFLPDKQNALLSSINLMDDWEMDPSILASELSSEYKVNEVDFRNALEVSGYIFSKIILEDMEKSDILEDMRKTLLSEEDVEKINKFIDKSLSKLNKKNVENLIYSTYALKTTIPRIQTIKYSLDERVVFNKDFKIIKKVPLAILTIVSEMDGESKSFLFQTSNKGLRRIINILNEIYSRQKDVIKTK